ncbi:MAG TPA: hypothetical protein VLM89_04430 [Phycisphaerae bacterium]|nr:hypothetical protein [Phycisphaerae bacterium]
MANIAVLKHFWLEGSGAFDGALTAVGHRLVTVNLHEGDPVPGPEDFDARLIMGGPMNGDEVDKHPYLPACSSLGRADRRAALMDPWTHGRSARSSVELQLISRAVRPV